MRIALSTLARYWSALTFGAAAVVLLILGAPTKAALAGAGFALFGAALTRGVDIANERRSAAAQVETDLDETRRLLYALLTKTADSPSVLVGTLLNALSHHGAELDTADALEHLSALDQGQAGDVDIQFVRDQIDRITQQLESRRPSRRLADRVPLAIIRFLRMFLKKWSAPSTTCRPARPRFLGKPLVRRAMPADGSDSRSTSRL